MNPAATIAISHPIWDVHFSGATLNSSPAYSGIFNWLIAVGYRNEAQLFGLVLASQTLALSFLLLGKIHISYSTASHYWSVTNRPVLSGFTDQSTQAGLASFVRIPIRYFSTYLESTGIRLNFHLSALIGSFSALWSCHLVHVSIPASRGLTIYDNPFTNQRLIRDISYGSLANFASCPDGPNHIFGSSNGAGSALITFIGGINSSTGSIHMSDIAHHHLSIGVIFIWASHLYSSFFRAFGQSAPALLSASGLKLVTKYIVKSLNLQLALALLSISIVTSLVGHQMYSLPAYPYISYDYVTTLALYIHHIWISSLAMIGAFAHASLFLIRDYTNPGSRSEDLVSRLLFHKAAIISHLSWSTLFLGFHTLGIFVHNDVVCAFGEPYKSLLIEPYLAQYSMNWLAFTTKSYGYLGSALVDSSFIKPAFSSDLMSSSLGPGDFMSYHAVALGLHVTSLILLKGALDSQGSSLMPDKVQFGFGFACDGPARGGTCDISSWDAFYLALFWVLNSNSWMMFYFHWKHLLFWQSLSLKFEENSTF
jgi:photosystem I P700 chlorophyll a apoprotein A2